MARIHGKDFTVISVDNAALSQIAMVADTVSLSMTFSGETHDTTTIGDQFREFTAGLKGGDDISHTIMYDNTNTTGNAAVYAGRLNKQGLLTISDGIRTYAMQTIVTKIAIPISVGDMVKQTITHKVTGAVTFS